MELSRATRRGTIISCLTSVRPATRPSSSATVRSPIRVPAWFTLVSDIRGWLAMSVSS